ncbi:MAG: cyclic nucleotide-binding domain-containing protein [Rhodomicrobium sp.]|nr:cyclic nucleotide-binding domain-containing protein [Rhodomicrobium sp.]
MLDPKIELLENLPIFHGLSRKQLGSIINVTTKSFFEAGDNLIAKDTAGDAAFLIMTGIARCLDFPGRPCSGDRIGPGALVGEMAMLAGTVHSVTVQAGERLRALTIRREALRREMENDSAIAQQISDNLLFRLQSLARDLRRFDAALAQVVRISASGRP